MTDLGVVNPLNMYAGLERKDQNNLKRKPGADNLDAKIKQMRDERIAKERAKMLEELQWKL